MYYVLFGVQCFGIAMLLGELLYVLKRWTSRLQGYFLFLLLAVLLGSVGNLFEMSAANKETAVAWLKMGYLGKAYVPLLALLVVAGFRKIKLSVRVIGMLALIHFFLMCMALTCDCHSLYYREITYVKEGAFPHLELKSGLFHGVFAFFSIAFLVIILVICIRGFRKAKNTQGKRQNAYLFFVVLLPTLGDTLDLLGVAGGYDVTATGYTVSSVLLFHLIVRGEFFDELELAKDYVVESLSDGLIVLGLENELVYSNKTAQEVCPELLTKEYEGALTMIKSYSGTRDMIFSGKKVYSVYDREIRHNEVLRGKMYLLKDVTFGYNYASGLETKVEDKQEEINHIQHSIISSFAGMVEARDGVTGEHIKHTEIYVGIIARALQKKEKYRELLTDKYVAVLVDAASLHDIGKIAMPDSILRKPGRLTAEEFEIIKTHAELGAKIIEDVLAEVEENEYLTVARELAYSHHEHWDGTGYPEGLKGEEIPLGARIMAIADVYDALRSKRSYKEAYPKEEARRIIEENAGTHFDPELVEAFLAHLTEIEAVQKEE